MRWFHLPLRFTLPGLLLAAGLLAQGGLLRAELGYAAKDVERRISASARMLGTVLSAEIETAFRTNRTMVARNLVMHAGSDPALDSVALFDQAGRVIFSSELRRDRSAARPSGLSTAPDRSAAMQHPQGSGLIEVDRAAKRVTAAFPVELPHAWGERRPAAGAVLVMFYDTSRPHALARNRAVARAAVQGGVVLGVVLAVYLALRWLLLARLQSLLHGARRIEKGDYGARVSLTGRDEIATLGRSFDAMAAQVASRDDALRVQELKLRTLLENLDDAVLALDRDGRIREANGAAEQVLGRPLASLPGTALADLVDAADAPRIQSTIEDLASSPGGGRAPVSVSISRDGPGSHQLELVIVRPAEPTFVGEFIASARDVTYRARIEQKLRQSHKTEAIGKLAGGIAHDFNNLLSVIQLSVTTLESEERLSPSGAELLQDVADASQRAADLTRQLLVYARRDVATPVHTDLNAVVGDMARLLSRLVPDNVALELDSHRDPLWVKLDRASVEQVVANLVINARDATSDGGRIEVVTRPGPGAQRVAQLVVTDNGCGMTGEVMERILDPFFSTKAGGTGLGLSTAYELVRQHGGDIDVESTPGRGTRFTVTLPASAAASAPTPEAPNPPAMPAQTGTVLVVEDQEQLRRIMSRTLKRAGFAVSLAGSAEEAISMFDREGAELSAVITDIGLPGMNGLDLRTELLRRRPGLPVLLTSGYADEPRVREQIEREVLPLLNKPFVPRQLLERLQELMPARAASDAVDVLEQRL